VHEESNGRTSRALEGQARLGNPKIIAERALGGNEGTTVECGRRTQRSFRSDSTFNPRDRIEPEDTHRAGAGLVQTEQVIDQRRLAGAVFPHQPQHDAARDLQADLGQGRARAELAGGSRKPRGDAAKVEKRGPGIEK